MDQGMIDAGELITRISRLTKLSETEWPDRHNLLEFICDIVRDMIDENRSDTDTPE